MKQLIISILLAFSASSCCKTIKSKHKIVEKTITQNRIGNRINYHLLFDNGHESWIDLETYANSKVGDVWLLTECKQ